MSIRDFFKITQIKRKPLGVINTKKHIQQLIKSSKLSIYLWLPVSVILTPKIYPPMFEKTSSTELKYLHLATAISNVSATKYKVIIGAAPQAPFSPPVYCRSFFKPRTSSEAASPDAGYVNSP